MAKEQEGKIPIEPLKKRRTNLNTDLIPFVDIPALLQFKRISSFPMRRIISEEISNIYVYMGKAHLIAFQ